jgi:GNAT superfamily N-acetyltransferase
LGVILAAADDRAEIEAFLTACAEHAMFPLSNLRKHGMTGGHTYAVSFWIIRRFGQISDLLCQTDGGMVMPILPSLDFFAASKALKGRGVAGIVGPTKWARGVQNATYLANAPSTLDDDEPHLLLNFSDLKIPDGPGEIAPLSCAREEIVKDWMLDYQLRALNTPLAEAVQRVKDSYCQYCETGSHVVLMHDGTPLAMTGFNAQMPEIVQIGGVYTPETLRGKGYARRAVALHLAHANAEGAKRATLFSASESATAAYRAIGFQEIGTWTLLLLRGKPVVQHG